jgi:hypothetical protein
MDLEKDVEEVLDRKVVPLVYNDFNESFYDIQDQSFRDDLIERFDDDIKKRDRHVESV